MANKSTLGIDIGYSNLCVVSGSAVDRTEQIYPVGAAPAGHQAGAFFGDMETVEVLVDDEKYVAMIDPDLTPSVERSLSENYIHSAAYRALFYSVLLKTGQGTIDQLVTGLPVNQFLEESTRKGLASKLQGVHRIGESSQVIVKKVDVLPQPYGAYIAALNLDENSKVFGEADVLVIDPGFFSVDWINVSRYQIKIDNSGTSTGATSMILSEAKKLITKERGIRINIERMEKALRQGADTILVGGERVEFLPYLEKASKLVAPNVMENIASSLRSNKSDVDFVVLAGGGAKLYEKAVRERFGKSKIIVLPQSVLSIARGFHQFGVAAQEG